MNEEIKSEYGRQKTEDSQQKAEVSKLSVVAFTTSIILMAGTSTFIFDLGSLTDIGCFTIPLFLVTPILAITSLLIFWKSKKKLRGLIYSWLGLLIWLVSIILFIDLTISVSNQVTCAENTRQLEVAFWQYGEEHGGYFPRMESWCDDLIIFGKLNPDFLRCPASGAKFGESSYAFNANLSGKRFHDAPADIVVLFETDAGKEKRKRNSFLKSRAFWEHYENKEQRSGEQKVYENRWNQHGGKKILTLKHHRKKGCHVIFGDWSREFVKAEDINNLNWGTEEIKD